MMDVECGLVQTTLRVPVWLVAVIDEIAADRRAAAAGAGEQVSRCTRSDVVRELLQAAVVNHGAVGDTPPC